MSLRPRGTIRLPKEEFALYLNLEDLRKFFKTIQLI